MPWAAPRNSEGVSIMDDASDPPFAHHDRRDAPLRGCSRPTHAAGYPGRIELRKTWSRSPRIGD